MNDYRIQGGHGNGMMGMRLTLPYGISLNQADQSERSMYDQHPLITYLRMISCRLFVRKIFRNDLLYLSYLHVNRIMDGLRL